MKNAVGPVLRMSEEVDAIIWKAEDYPRWWPSTAAFGGYKYGEQPMAALRQVDWASGAALLIPRGAWERVGEFDRGIFMYMEEVDWCLRAAASGLLVRYVPEAQFMHSGQRSSS